MSDGSVNLTWWQWASLGLAGALCLPYIAWILDAPPETEPGAIRGLTALGAALTLGYARRERGARRPAQIASVSGALLAAVLSVGALAHSALLWFFSLPLVFAAGLLAHDGKRAIRRNWAPLVLCGLAFPFERLTAGGVDRYLQTLVARSAQPLVSATGLPMEFHQLSEPTLAADHLLVRVSAPCAGAQTHLGMITLGLVLGDVLFERLGAKLLMVGLITFLGFGANVVRVVVSAHAADAWLEEGSWDLAHELIRYATSTSLIVLVYVIVRLSYKPV